MDRYGGHPVLDFVNTVSWRTDPERRTERLPDLASLVAWAVEVGLIDEAITPKGTGLAATYALREAVHGVLAATVEGGAPAPADLSVIQAATLDAMGRARLAGPVPLRWALTPRVPADLPRLLALASLELLRSPDLALLRRCEGSGCGWFFLDRSRSHTRRWCSGGDCGNRERARRHYARTRR